MLEFPLTCLTISRAKLDEVLDRADEGRSEHVSNERMRPVKLADIAVTGSEYPQCRCEDDHVGLVAGMTVHSLLHLGSGCTDSRFHDGGQGWVCPRLVRLRRIYGH